MTDCCADRADGAHEANLSGMTATAKDADGRTAEEVMACLGDLPERGSRPAAGPAGV